MSEIGRLEWDSHALHHPPNASDGLDPPYTRCGYSRRNKETVVWACPKQAIYVWYENDLRYLSCEEHMDKEAIERSRGKYTRLI